MDIGRFTVRQNISKVGNGFSRQLESNVISLNSSGRVLDKNMNSDHGLQSPGDMYSCSLKLKESHSNRHRSTAMKL